MRTIRLWPVDVAREHGRSADWLRMLERQGVIPPAPRDFAGRRYYLPEHVAQIRKIIAAHYQPSNSVA